MRLILDLFKGFEVEYDKKYKIFYVNKAMPTRDFVKLKFMLSRVVEEVEDIRLFDDKYRKKRAYE